MRKIAIVKYRTRDKVYERGRTAERTREETVERRERNKTACGREEL